MSDTLSDGRGGYAGLRVLLHRLWQLHRWRTNTSLPTTDGIDCMDAATLLLVVRRRFETSTLQVLE